jgi:hypothetical protein
VSAGWDSAPAWLVDRIEQEIRRGLGLVRRQTDLAGFSLETIRFSLYLGGRWQATSFDGEGRRLTPGVQ